MRCFSHLELFLQMCSTTVSWCRNAVEVTVELTGCHFCFLSQNCFHQGIMDEDVLLLDQPKKQKKVFAANMSKDSCSYCTHGINLNDKLETQL